MVEYEFEVGDIFEGSPIELNKWLSPAWATGCVVQFDGNRATIISVPLPPEFTILEPAFIEEPVPAVEEVVEAPVEIISPVESIPPVEIEAFVPIVGVDISPEFRTPVAPEEIIEAPVEIEINPPVEVETPVIEIMEVSIPPKPKPKITRPRRPIKPSNPQKEVN